MAISGEIIMPGDAVDFTYSGDVQEWTVPVSGLYKLEVTGAYGGNTVTEWSGGNVTFGGAGGTSIGYIVLKSKTKLYIGVGQGNVKANSGLTKTFNGGGPGSYRNSGEQNHPNSRDVCGLGGGATHIAIDVNLGELENYENSLDKILIVAGGGGGAGNVFTPSGGYYVSGGSGGGNIGGSNGTSNASGGTQSGIGSDGVFKGSFGKGGGYSGEYTYMCGGGGGGLYGGNSAPLSGGAGGSGYIGGVPEIILKGTTYTPSTTNGVFAYPAPNYNGFAKITLIEAVSDHAAYCGDVPIMLYLGDLAVRPFL